MKLTTRGRYAVTAMLDLALHQQEEPIALADIALRQQISLSYLEQLFSRLRQKGLVCSTRGPGGGYCLNRPPEQINIAEIIDAVDENVDTTRCGGLQNCHSDGPCITHHLWSDLSDEIRRFLTSISLSFVIERHLKGQTKDRKSWILHQESFSLKD
jgi:Rrf2 family iron-sulfur cluster assembly transcriptional regulator